MRGLIVAAGLAMAGAAWGQTPPPRVGIISEGVPQAACNYLKQCLDAGFDLKTTTSVVLPLDADGFQRVLVTHYLQRGRQLVQCTSSWFPGGQPQRAPRLEDIPMCGPVL